MMHPPSATHQTLVNLVTTQRIHYHRGLLDWYRDATPQQGLQQISAVLQQLTMATQIEPLPSAYALAHALADALIDHPLATRTTVKLSFGHLGRTFKHILDHDEALAAAQLPAALLAKQRRYLAQIDPEHALLTPSEPAPNPVPIIPPSPCATRNLQKPDLTPVDPVFTQPVFNQELTPPTPTQTPQPIYRDTPSPTFNHSSATDTTPLVHLSIPELDWMLDQIESLNNQQPNQSQGDALQAALLAKRLTPIQQLIPRLQAQFKDQTNQDLVLKLHSIETVIQTDSIAPLIDGLITQYTQAQSSAKQLTLHIHRDSYYLHSQLQTAEQRIGTSIQQPYRYALSQALLIEHQGTPYAIATHSLIKIICLNPSEISEPHILYENRPYSLCTLDDLLHKQHRPFQLANDAKINLLLAQANQKYQAIQIDHLLGHHQCLIKPIAPPLHQIPWVSGGLRLPNGRIALHVQLDQLVANNGHL